MDPRSLAKTGSSPEAPAIPRASAIAWRLAPFVDERRVDAYLRLLGARSLPIGVERGRLAAMGLSQEVTTQALRRVRRIRDWPIAWTWAAQRFLGEARTQTRAGQVAAAALNQRHAALAYHLAALLVFDDPRTLRALRASASTLFAQALPIVHPTVRRFDLPWRTARLPAYLALPEELDHPAPLAVLLNGASTSKEETLLWSGAFLAQGLAVLALDWPGSGESALTVAPTAECDDLMDAIVSLVDANSAIDGGRVGLVGLSLGAAITARVAAADRRVAAIVAVTPSYDPRTWLPYAQPLLQRHLVALAGGAERARHLAAAFALPGVVARIRCPSLVIGAGSDLVVPPEESLRFCAEAGANSTLLWYPGGRHGLYEELPDWTTEAARWLAGVTEGITPSTWVDDPLHAVPATRVL